MAWMIYQRYTTAILDAYVDDPDVANHLRKAREYREWLESLRTDNNISSALVEQARIVEEAFERLAG